MSQSGSTEYQMAHKAVKDIHGPASLHPCEFCGGQAIDWAYNHRDPNEKVARFNRCAYSLDPNCYIPLCRSCHCQFDMGSVERRSRQDHGGMPYWPVCPDDRRRFNRELRLAKDPSSE